MNQVGGTAAAVRSGTVSISREHRSFTSLARHQILEMIIDGRLEPGDRLNEVELAEALEISRGPIREAIQRLAGDGLVVMRSHRGAVVKIYSMDEVRELYELLFALETFAVGGLRRIAQVALDDFAELLRSGGTTTAGHRDDVQATEIDFHSFIVGMTDNAAVVEMHQKTLQRLQLALSKGTRRPTRVAETLQEHRAIVDAIRSRDARAVTAAMEAHLAQSIRAAEAALESRPRMPSGLPGSAGL